jgi:ATP-dependent DNA ligase
MRVEMLSRGVLVSAIGVSIESIGDRRRLREQRTDPASTAAVVGVDSPSFRSTVIKWAMLWRSPAPVRHPAGFIEPCLPTLGHTVPTGSQWAYEIKHDGFRFICGGDQGDRRLMPAVLA